MILLMVYHLGQKGGKIWLNSCIYDLAIKIKIFNVFDIILKVTKNSYTCKFT